MIEERRRVNNGIEEVVGSIPSGSTNQPVDITGLSVSPSPRHIRYLRTGSAQKSHID
jgi:hypothetical protein